MTDDDDLRREVGERLRQLRERAGASYAAVAEYAGVHFTTLYDYEAGKSTPNLLVSARLALFFEVSVEDLVPTRLLSVPDRRKRLARKRF